LVEKYIKDSGHSPLKWFFLAVFTALFILDLWLVVAGRIQLLDDSILAVFFAARDNILTMIFRLITLCGDQASVIVLCVLIIILPGRMKIGLPVALMTGIGAAVQTVFKEAVARPRPGTENWLIGETDWMGFDLGYSFPSGHANTSLIFWVALMVLVGRHLILQDNRLAAVLLRIVFAAFAVLIGLSRLYLGVHYPSDVFGGWMLGGALLITFFALYDNFWPAKWRISYEPHAWDAMPHDSEKRRRWRKPAKKRAPKAMIKFPKKHSPWKF